MVPPTRAAHGPSCSISRAPVYNGYNVECFPKGTHGQESGCCLVQEPAEFPSSGLDQGCGERVFLLVVQNALQNVCLACCSRPKDDTWSCLQQGKCEASGESPMGGPPNSPAPAGGSGLGGVSRCGHRDPHPESAGRKAEWNPLGRPVSPSWPSPQPPPRAARG